MKTFIRSTAIRGAIALVAILSTTPAMAAPTFGLTVTPTPAVNTVQAGNPGAFSFTVKNISSSDNANDNVNVVIDSVGFGAGGALKFLNGDANNQAFGAAIQNPGQFANLVLLPQATFVYIATFQSQDLSPIQTNDVGTWYINTFIAAHPQANAALSIFGAGQPDIRVVGIPEPTLAGTLGIAAYTLLCRRRKLNRS